MRHPKLELLAHELKGLESAAEHLRYSQQRCQGLYTKHQWTAEDLERLESFSSRFARLADLIIQRMMRLIDEVELVTQGSLLDRIFRAEKRGWINAQELIRIRELRNTIAHEYADENMADIYAAVAVLAPRLLALVPAIQSHVKRLLLTLESID